MKVFLLGLVIICLGTTMGCDTVRTSGLTRAADGTYYQVVSGRSTDIFDPSTKAMDFRRYEVVSSKVEPGKDITECDVKNGLAVLKPVDETKVTAAGPSVTQQTAGAAIGTGAILFGINYGPNQVQLNGNSISKDAVKVANSQAQSQSQSP